MKHHATVQHVRERYISRREKFLNNFLRIFSRRLLYRLRTVWTVAWCFILMNILFDDEGYDDEDEGEKGDEEAERAQLLLQTGPPGHDARRLHPVPFYVVVHCYIFIYQAYNGAFLGTLYIVICTFIYLDYEKRIYIHVFMR